MKRENKKFLKVLIIMSLSMGILSLMLMLISNVRDKNNTYISIDVDTMELIQLEKPKEGDPIAIVETSLGEFRFVLYPDRCPEAVKNFTELAESGYYDNTYIYDSNSGAYSSGGSKKKDGSFDSSDSHEHIKRELDQDLWPFRGAVCCDITLFDRSFKEKILGGGTYYCGSRLTFVNTIEFTDDIKKQLRESSAGEKLSDAFISLGGIPNFSQQMTVIGQTYQGLDVIEKLASVDAVDNGMYHTPSDDVMILSVRTDTYSEQEKSTETVDD